MLKAIKAKARKEFMLRECEEKENTFLNWPKFSEEPWKLRERYKKSQMWKRGSFDYDVAVISHPKRTDADFWSEFTPLPTDILLREFFTDTGKPRLGRLGQHFDKWLVWCVTGGRYRMDQKKKMWVFKGMEPSILHLLQSKGHWERVNQCCEGFPILSDITDECNRAYAAILRKLSQHEGKQTKYFKCIYHNLICHPHMVMFQSYLKPDHKQYRWHFLPEPCGGNKTGKTAKPLRLRKNSVHWILMNYHLWLPEITQKLKRKQKVNGRNSQ